MQVWAQGMQRARCTPHPYGIYTSISAGSERQVATRTKEGGGSLPQGSAQIIVFVYGVALYQVAQAGLQLTLY